MTFRDPNNLIKIAFIFILLGVVEYGWLGLLTPLENRLNDALVGWHASTLQADQDIVIVDIDEESLEFMATDFGRYPWPRAVYADLLQHIQQQQPKAIVFDIVFSDRDYSTSADSDNYFNETIQQTDNTYFAMLRRAVASPENDAKSRITLGKYGEALGLIPTDSAQKDASLALVIPAGAATDSGRLGTIDFNEDDDGIGRRYDLFTEAYGWLIPSLPARVAIDLNYLAPRQESFLMHWRGNQRAHPRISFASLYKDATSAKKQREQNELRDKIIIIGSTAPILGDLRATPIASLHPGAEILATAIDNLKNGQLMQQAGPLFAALLTLLLITLLFGTFRRTSNAATIFLLFAPLTPLLIGVSYAALNTRILLPVLSPLLFGWLYYAAASLSEYLSERRARQRTVDEFGRFLDPQVVKQVISGDQTLAKAYNCEISVLFSDIRNFTTLSEGRSPQLIFAILNRYFSSQVSVIFKHGGTMDKFIGDAIMAFWGAPLENQQHARYAVAAALDMSDQIPVFRKLLARIARLAENGETDKLGDLVEVTSLEELAGLKNIAPDFEIGIGIHSGPATVGMLGFEGRMDYTCIGDAVNTASRTEGQTKGKARILVTAETREQCGDEFDFIDHGFFKVKGREQEVHLYEPTRKGQSS